MTDAAPILPTERDKMLAGELYDAMDPELVEMRVLARERLAAFNASPERDSDARRAALALLLGKPVDALPNVTIQPPFYCDYGVNIELGERVFMNFNCEVLDVCRVVIGDYTMLGPCVQVLTPMHPLDAVARRGKEYGRPVTIGRDVWIGAGAIICPGVTVGGGAVIGAGSVVTRDVPARVLAVGNPCRVVREV